MHRVTENGKAMSLGCSHLMESDQTDRRCWLAAYTRPRHETQVAQQLHHKQLEFLLPTYNKMKRFEIPHGTGRLLRELPGRVASKAEII